MKFDKLTNKDLVKLKSKHVDKFYYYENHSEVEKKIINSINEEQVNRLLKKVGYHEGYAIAKKGGTDEN